ncbi:MAG: hypothetical protein HYZ16_08655 [Bacteroidetes bacterium]|jgi:hypothetical protein|nr:hypothetical protein [Bacteroidota bacterium]
MDSLSPKERILKDVRASLLLTKSKQHPEVMVKPQVPKLGSEDEALEALRLALDTPKLKTCKNKYEFLDKFISYLEPLGEVQVVCRDKKINSFFDSCDLLHYDQPQDDGQGFILVLPFDYLEPNGQAVYYDYSTDMGSLVESAASIALVGFKDQLVKSPQLLMDRVKNRLPDADLLAARFFMCANTIEQPGAATLFVINQRLTV